MKISLNNNIWKFYAIKALGIYFIAPIRIIYLISFGLTFSQIGMMELAAAIAVIVLEIPSGIYAVFTTLLNQPYLLSRGYTVQSLGVIFSIITGAGGLIASLTHKIEPILKQRTSFVLIVLSFVFLLISMGLINNQFVIFLIILFYIVDNFKNVIIDNYLNETIESESRATVLSVQSFFNNIFISILFVFIGYIVDIFSIDFVLISMGLLVAIVCFPLWLYDKST